MDGRNVLRTLTDMKLRQTGGRLPVGGYSMIPFLVAGDVIQVTKQDAYKIGDIIVCIDQAPKLVVHRVIRIEKTGDGLLYITKGDNAVASEQIESEYCFGKVTEVSNSNGKYLKVETPRLRDKITVFLSKKVNLIYNTTHDPNAAFSSRYNRRIYDSAPDYLKKYVYEAQDYMLRKMKDYIEETPPSAGKESFLFTKDFYAMLINHRVINVLSAYVMPESGRFGKLVKLAKARNLAAAAKRLEWCRKITEAFEAAGIQYVVYKGIAVSYFIYGDAVTRECDDIDLLIEAKDVQAAHTIMNRLGFYYLNGGNFCQTETPTEEYPTHLTPYVVPQEGVTAELHTALYIDEAHTAGILARRQKIRLEEEYAFYVLGDLDLYVCQLYVTAVDDFGCSNISCEEDPNIFLRLKLRNYLDTALLTRRFQHLKREEILKMAIAYDINFYLYLALDYTCKIFEPAGFLEPVQELRDFFKEYEDLDERLFRLPVDAHACLDSPFKMKMNGRALRRLRDAFYMSEAWKRKQAEFQEGKFLELRSGSPLCFRNGDISETIRRDGKKLKFELALNPSVLPGEFIVAVRKMNPQKYRKQGDYGYDMKFLYVDMHKNTMKEGILKIDSVQPWKERMEAVYRALNGKVKYWKFPVKIRKKSTFVYDSKNKKYKIKIIFAYKVKRLKNPYIYEFFSTFMFEFKGSELIKMFKISTKTDENLKISFD